VTSARSLSWLRCLVAAVRRWAGTLAEGLARWEHHQSRWAGGTAASFWLAPLPPLPAGAVPEADRRGRIEAERLRARLLEGVRLAPALLPATRLGAVIHAQLESGAPDAPPAILVVDPGGTPCPGTALVEAFESGRARRRRRRG
jgi:hypothetical protein